MHFMVESEEEESHSLKKEAQAALLELSSSEYDKQIQIWSNNPLQRRRREAE